MQCSDRPDLQNITKCLPITSGILGVVRMSKNLAVAGLHAFAQSIAQSAAYARRTVLGRYDRPVCA